MHFKDDRISDMHAKTYLIIWCMKPLLRPQNLVPSFGPVFSGAVPSNTTTLLYYQLSNKIFSFKREN